MLPLVDSRAANHVFAGYWVLVIVAIHLGLRWPLIMNAARNLSGVSKPCRANSRASRSRCAIAIHGVWSSFALGVGTKLSIQMTLDWWNFESRRRLLRPLHCIAGLYIFLTYYAMNVINTEGAARHGAIGA